MREKEIEKYLNQEVGKLGGICKKWVSPGSRGVPDRIVILPRNRIYFVELKTPEGELSPIQEYRINELENLGVRGRVLSTKKLVDWIISEVS